MVHAALLVSTAVDPTEANEVARGLRPLPDYLALAEALPAVLLDGGAARQHLSPVLHRLASRAGRHLPQVVMAARARHQFDRFICDSEALALPLAAILRRLHARQPVYFIAHRMTARSKRLLWRGLRLDRQCGGVFCYADLQAESLRRQHLPADRLHRIAFHADHRFFQPGGTAEARLVVSVGQEHRDYPTLMTAAGSLDCQVSILARSPWSKTRLDHPQVSIPTNVHFLPRLSAVALRELYAAAAVVAVPVAPVDFQAGITTLLEAMAMARPVVATANPGLREIFAPGEAGLWVPPGQPEAMAKALNYVLSHPREAREMGRRGRALVEQGMTLEHWVHRITTVIRSQQ